MNAYTNMVTARADGFFNLIVAANAAPSGARQGIVYLLLIAAVLGAFVFIVALISALRRRARRESSREERPDANQPDAWKEAGRRVEP